MTIAFIALVGILVYTWVLYPAIILLSGGRGRGKPLDAPHDKSLPSVAILFSAHNEEAVILKRLENLALLDYPPDRLHVHVGIDGGTDRTAEIARDWAKTHPHVTVLAESRNSGKMAMLKRLVGRETIDHRPLTIDLNEEGATDAKSSDSLLVFTDANTMFAPDALRRLISPFSDPQVGGVCGRLVFEKSEVSSSPGTDEPIYWNFETRLKLGESGMDSCLGANGAIYAIRAELFPAEIPDNTIIDDFVIGMKVREQGWRMVYEPAAVATEELPVTVQDEWRRRVRIGAGAYQALCLCRACLSPRHGVFAWMFWSHKVLRWFTPHMGIAFLVLGSWFVGGGVTKGTWFWVCCLLGLVALSLALRPCRKSLMLLAYFVTMQVALFMGFIRFCKGNLSGAWERTERG